MDPRDRPATPPGPAPHRRTLLLGGAALAIWTLLAGVVAPILVRAAHAGRSIAQVNRLFAGHRAEQPIELHLDRVRVLAAGGAALIVAFVACALLLAEDRRRAGALSRRLIRPATPESLAAIRIIVLSLLLTVVVWEDAPSTALIPRSVLDMNGKGIMALLSAVPGYRAFLASFPALLAFRVALIGVLVLGIFGYRTRIVLPLSTIGYLLYGGILRHYTHFFHQGLLPLYPAAVLCFTPCADAWSMDHGLKKARGEPVPPADSPSVAHGLGRWAVIAITGLCYFSAGLSKLRDGGLLWWEAPNMRTKILSAMLEPRLDLSTGKWFAAWPDTALAALGLLTLAVEISMILVLVSRRSRLILAPAVALIQTAIFLAQDLFLLDIVLLPLIFIYPHHLLRAVHAAPEGRAAIATHLRALLTDSGFKKPTSPEERASALPSENTPPPGGRPLALLFTVGAYLISMALAVEWYPLTAWPLFSQRAPAPRIEYIKAREILAGGDIAPMRIEKDIRALLNTRSYDTIWPYLNTRTLRDRQRLDDLLATAMQLRNARVSPPQRIAGFRIEHRRWDWAAAPGDPDRSEVLHVYTYPHPTEDTGTASLP